MSIFQPTTNNTSNKAPITWESILPTEYKMQIPTRVERTLESYKHGHNFILIDEGHFSDFDINYRKQNSIEELKYILFQTAIVDQNMAVITCSLSGGVKYLSVLQGETEEGKKIKQEVNSLLQKSRCTDTSCQDSETLNLIRTIDSLANAKTQTCRLLIHIEFGQHLLPTEEPAHLTEAQNSASELIQTLSNSLRLRLNNHFIILSANDEINAESIKSCKTLKLDFPKGNEKETFVKCLLKRYENCKLDSLSIDQIVSLTTNLPNRGLEKIVREASLSGKSLSARDISFQRESDIKLISNSLLSPIKPYNVKLGGRSIQIAHRALKVLYKALLNETDHYTIALLMGAPGNGKTDLVRVISKESGLPAYKIASPKSSLVGGTERNIRIIERNLLSHKNIAFLDELDLGKREDTNLDAGTSKAVQTGFLEMLSNPKIKGNNLFVFATNLPNNIGEAMLSRMKLKIPVLLPQKRDLPNIISAIIQSTPTFGTECLKDNDSLLEASELLSNKLLSPRDISTMFATVSLNKGGLHLTSQDIVESAKMARAFGGRNSVIYAEYLALKYCSLDLYLPWYNLSKNEYDIVPHILEVLNSDHSLNYEALETRINELKSQANV